MTSEPGGKQEPQVTTNKPSDKKITISLRLWKSDQRFYNDQCKLKVSKKHAIRLEEILSAIFLLKRLDPVFTGLKASAIRSSGTRRFSCWVSNSAFLLTCDQTCFFLFLERRGKKYA